MKLRAIAFIAFLLLSAATAMANPTQFGPTGLLNIPSADTLDAGNICVGLWGNLSDSNNGGSVTIPATITLGIGAFWELYGTYPNILLNGDETTSGRGTVDAGSKIRFYGNR